MSDQQNSDWTEMKQKLEQLPKSIAPKNSVWPSIEKQIINEQVLAKMQSQSMWLKWSMAASWMIVFGALAFSFGSFKELKQTQEQHAQLLSQSFQMIQQEQELNIVRTQFLSSLAQSQHAIDAKEYSSIINQLAYLKMDRQQLIAQIKSDPNQTELMAQFVQAIADEQTLINSTANKIPKI